MALGKFIGDAVKSRVKKRLKKFSSAEEFGKFLKRDRVNFAEQLGGKGTLRRKGISFGSSRVAK